MKVVTPTIIRVGAVDLSAEWATPEMLGPLRIKVPRASGVVKSWSIVLGNVIL